MPRQFLGIDFCLRTDWSLPLIRDGVTGSTVTLVQYRLGGIRDWRKDPRWRDATRGLCTDSL